MSLNLHLYQSPITNESRILKITKSLAKKKYFSEIHIVGLYDHGLPRRQKIHERIFIVRVKNIFHTTNPASKLRYLTLIEWNVRVLLLYLFRKVSCVNAHSVPVLPVACALKIFKKLIFIYDTHELETETETEGFGKRISKVIERLFVRASDYIVVVGESIRDWYKSEYNLTNLLVIKNIPNKSSLPVVHNLKERFGIAPHHILFIYQGNLSGLRGVNEILAVFSQVPKDRHILFMGFGSLADKVKSIAEIESNIHYLPAVPPEEILSYTAGADVGVHIIPNSCLNNYYCLPNKLFEYNLAGIPFIGSDFPDIRAEFGAKKVAWLIEPDETSLLNRVLSLTKAEVDEFRSNSEILRSELTWENQEPKLFQMYDTLIKS